MSMHAPARALSGSLDPAALEFKPDDKAVCEVFAMYGGPGEHLSSDVVTLDQLAGMQQWEFPVTIESFATEQRPQKQVRGKKEFEIRNPKTGEFIRPEVMREDQEQIQTTASSSQARVQGPQSFSREKWTAAAAVAVKKLRIQKMRPDHSMFSCLNLDGVRQMPKSSPSGDYASARVSRAASAQPTQQQDDNLHQRQKTSASTTKLRPLPEVPGCPMEKVPACTAQMLAVLSLEPGRGVPRKKSDKTSSKVAIPREQTVAALKMPWRPNRFVKKQDDEEECNTKTSSSEELSTSAGDSRSDVASETQERLDEDVLKSPHLGRSSEVATCLDNLLRFRFCVHDEAVPREIETLRCKELEASVVASAGIAPLEDSGIQRRPSATAYRPGSTPKSPQSEMTRQVQSLLNKVCPESVATICEKIAEIKVDCSEELELIIGIIFKKALSEPHYCETYADLVFGLKDTFPAFPSPTGGKPVTLKAALLNICQSEFETLPTCMETTQEELEQCDREELEFRKKKIKDRVLANMKLIGHLFLRSLLSAKVIGSIITELVLCNSVEQIPEEHIIECAVELLMSIGHTLESLPVGKAVLQQVCSRLKDLKSMKKVGEKSVYCKRIQFAIQDLLDVRQAGWTRKVFGGGRAKTKEEIRLEQQRELTAQALGKETPSAQQVVAGKRPVYLADQN